MHDEKRVKSVQNQLNHMEGLLDPLVETLSWAR